MSTSRKYIIEKFITCVNDPKLPDLDLYLEKDIKKTINSEIVYNNIDEARQYYIQELDGDSTSQWSIVECELDDPNNNTLRARISHKNKTSDTLYTFSLSDKIQRMDIIN